MRAKKIGGHIAVTEKSEFVDVRICGRFARRPRARFISAFPMRARERAFPQCRATPSLAALNQSGRYSNQARAASWAR
jgi:hypothetical protein